MIHIGTMYLETPRLILRQFIQTDAKAMYNNWASDSEVTKYLTWPAHKDITETEYIINLWIESYKSSENYQWAITLKSNDEPIGSISVVHKDDGLEVIEIGYCIGREYWHKGYTSEALRELIKFFFENIGANRIQARHDPRNPMSGKVMLKCGMSYEGTIRQYSRNNQGICDTCYYGILREEYEYHRNQDAMNKLKIEFANSPKPTRQSFSIKD